MSRHLVIATPFGGHARGERVTDAISVGVILASDQADFVVPVAAPVIGCVYPLNATLAQLEAVNFANTALLPGDDGQSGSYTVVGGLSDTATAVMTTDIDHPQLIDLGSGKKAIEFVIDLPAYASSPLSIMAGFELTTLDNANAVSASAYKDTDGSLRLVVGAKVSGSGNFVHGSGGHGFGPHRVLVEFDSSSATFAVKLDGVALALSNNAYSAVNGYAVALLVAEPAGCSSSDAGLVVNVALVSNAGSMQTPLDAGYTDICGNSG